MNQDGVFQLGHQPQLSQPRRHPFCNPLNGSFIQALSELLWCSLRKPHLNGLSGELKSASLSLSLTGPQSPKSNSRKKGEIQISALGHTHSSEMGKWLQMVPHPVPGLGVGGAGNPPKETGRRNTGSVGLLWLSLLTAPPGSGWELREA